MEDRAQEERRDMQPGRLVTEVRAPVLTFDFPDVEIGIAEYSNGPTGCTVFNFPNAPPNGYTTFSDPRGGCVGTVGNYRANNAIVFAGGSLLGLEAAVGVGSELWRRKNCCTMLPLPAVSGAVIYDFGQRPGNAIYPDLALGRAAVSSARPGLFPMGTQGAGLGARVGKGLHYTDGEPSGQGGAFADVQGIKILLLCVVNAMGAIVGRDGTVVRGHCRPNSPERYRLGEQVVASLSAVGPSLAVDSPGSNTTLTLLVTNRKMTYEELGQLARQVHTSMARAIQPFHTAEDGDILYAVSTEEMAEGLLDLKRLGILASELAWDAILTSCQPCQAAPLDAR